MSRPRFGQESFWLAEVRYIDNVMFILIHIYSITYFKDIS